MSFTGQIDTLRIHLVLEGILIWVKLVELILLLLASELTFVRFLLPELCFLCVWEHSEAMQEMRGGKKKKNKVNQYYSTKSCPQLAK